MVGRWAFALFLTAVVSCAERGAVSPPNKASDLPPASSAPVFSEGAAASPLFAYATVQVGEGIYAFVPPEPASGVVSGNSMIVIGDDGVLVVDTGRFPTLARKMIADVRRLTNKPVRYIVTTHWHPDHNLGNAEYARAFPGVTILAHAETRRLILKNLPKQVEIQRHSQETLDELKEAERRGKHKDGRPFSDDERAYIASTIPPLEATLADAKELALAPPTATFEGEGVSVFLGKREVKILHLGRGNTAGDTIVYVPDAKVLATGDLVVSPSPYPEWCYPREWIDTLGKLIAMDARAIVPGHGAVEHDFGYVKTERDALSALRTQMQAAAGRGLTLGQATASLDLEEFRRRMAGDDPVRNRWFRTEFVETAADRAYQEAKGAMAEE
jgi:cyclase